MSKFSFLQACVVKSRVFFKNYIFKMWARECLSAVGKQTSCYSRRSPCGGWQPHFHVWKWTKAVKPQAWAWAGQGAGVAFLMIKQVLAQRDGPQKPFHPALGLGSQGFFSPMAPRTETMGSRRASGTAQPIARKHPGCGGSPPRRTWPEGARLTQKQSPNPENQCHFSSHTHWPQHTGMHNSPQSAIHHHAPARPALKEG